MNYTVCILFLTAFLIVSTRGAPATMSTTDESDLLQKLAETLDRAKNNEGLQPVLTPGDESLPNFERTEVQVNDCPTCVADSFRWESKK